MYCVCENEKCRIKKMAKTIDHFCSSCLPNRNCRRNRKVGRMFNRARAMLRRMAYVYTCVSMIMVSVWVIKKIMVWDELWCVVNDNGGEVMFICQFLFSLLSGIIFIFFSTVATWQEINTLLRGSWTWTKWTWTGLDTANVSLRCTLCLSAHPSPCQSG